MYNIVYASWHPTLFEVLGNFSFGDYFKKDAIFFGWDFLTREMGLDGERMTVSVFREDDEAYDIWHQTMWGPASRIIRFDGEENFWSSVPRGPEQLRPRSVQGDYRGNRGCKRHRVREIPSPGRPYPRDRRPRPRDGVPGRRRRPSRQRGEGARPPQDHAACPAPREEARAGQAVPAPGGGRRGSGVLFPLPRAGEERPLQR